MLIPIAAGLAVALAASGVLAGTKVPAPARTPHHTRVDGSVYDREGTAVAGATVVVRPAGTVRSLAASTRTFQLGMPPGTYWFIAFAAGASGLGAGASPALPVIDHLEVAIRLEEQSTRA